MASSVEITPSPRVLRMLGQIDFAPWQCLAELIDNSIDAFLDQAHAGIVAANPRISVSLPSGSELDRDAGILCVTDNASGMTLDQLQNAVRAGYSGNDPVDKMGLFGMGFNISTARLGRRTEIWTTTSESPDWICLRIDFDELERSKTFQAPILTKPKSEEELERRMHGTRIEISKLEPDRIRSLSWGAGKSRTRKRLGKIYGRVMAAHGIQLSYDGDRVTPWKHCVWNKDRVVQTQDFGNVPAVIEINETLPPRRFCTTCWVWLLEKEDSCSACGKATSLVERKRTLKGWIGVQRYFDKQHYGFDLLRNGRVIEELEKSMFSFRDSTGEDVFEYPRDAIHWGGRFVGELEIDFVRVSHQKDSFDKLDPEWKHVIELVRGMSPVQPKIAERMQLPPNRSPLARLFAGYRKGTAGLRDLVPGDSKGDGVNSGQLMDWVDRFHAGEAEYQDDTKWFDLVLLADRAKRGESSGADQAAGEIPLPGTRPAATDKRTKAPPRVSEPEPEAIEQDVELSKVYSLRILEGSPTVTVQAFRHTGASVGRPFSIQPDGARVRFDYHPRAPFFAESLKTPLDCLLVDLAHHFLALSASTPRTHPVSEIAEALRKEYFPETLTQVESAADAAEALLDELRAHLDQSLIGFAPINVEELPATLVEQVRQRAYSAEAATEQQVRTMIEQGSFARYVDLAQLAALVERWPTSVLDGSFLWLPFATLAAGMQKESIAELIQALRENPLACR